jgi:DNA-binding Lrp family transcriptional regulator
MPHGAISPQREYIVDGRRTTLKALADQLGLSIDNVYRRILVRQERGIKLTVKSIGKSIQGYGLKANSSGNTPARQYIHTLFAQQGKTLTQFAKQHGYGKSVRALYGVRYLKPEHINEFAEFLVLTDEEEREMHRLAAREMGWKV